MRRLTLVVIFLLLCVFGVVTGCTTSLNVKKVKNETQSDALEGPIYYLPHGQFDIEVKRQIMQCDLSPEEDPAEDEDLIKVKFSIEAEVTPKFVPDLTIPYRIDYNELNGLTKKTSLKVELYENGTLKSINADAADRTGSILSNTTKGLVKIARMAMGLPEELKMIDEDEEIEIPPCNASTNIAIREYDSLLGQIEEKERQLLNERRDAHRQSLETEIDNLKSKIVKYESQITHVQTYHNISPQFDDEGKWEEQLLVSPKLFLKWFNNENLVSGLVNLKNLIDTLETQRLAHLDAANRANREGDENEKKRNQDLADTILKDIESNRKKIKFVSANASLPEAIQEIAKELNLVAQMRVGKMGLAHSSREMVEETESLVYRQPGSAELRICKQTSCELKDNIIYKEPHMLPQAGIYTTLPLVNDLFDTNALTATFDLSGNLKTFEFLTESQLEAASASFAETVGSAGRAVDSKRDSGTIKLQRELDRIELEIKIKEAQIKKDALFMNE